MHGVYHREDATSLDAGNFPANKGNFARQDDAGDAWERGRGLCGSGVQRDRFPRTGTAARALVTKLPDEARLRRLAESLAGGALVGSGTREEVYEARRSCADLDHVMFVEGSRDEIPWAEAWFDVILDPEPEAPTAEVRRVLKPGGGVRGGFAEGR